MGSATGSSLSRNVVSGTSEISRRGSHISQMQATDVRDIANQLSLGCIATTTSFVRRHNLILCTAEPKRGTLLATFQITMNESFDRPGFVT
jgi:hypothetical protein